jgi:hypothetical protein
MQQAQFILCCFCYQPTKAKIPAPVNARFAHVECYVEHVKTRENSVKIASSKGAGVRPGVRRSA